MEDLAWRVRLSVLWFILEAAMIIFGTLELEEPGFIEKMIAGTAGSPATPEQMLALTGMLLIPLVMAFLSQTLKDRMNRWANIVMGAVFAILSVLTPLDYLANQSAYSGYATLIGITEFMVAALVIWYAYKWPKEKA
jgi:hypothetical protein